MPASETQKKKNKINIDKHGGGRGNRIKQTDTQTTATAHKSEPEESTEENDHIQNGQQGKWSQRSASETSLIRRLIRKYNSLFLYRKQQ